jgi:hypothetical protein
MGQLQIPAEWDFVREDFVDRPCTDLVATCPEVRREYRVQADPSFEQAAVAMLESAGIQARSLESQCAIPDEGCRITGVKDHVSVAVIVVRVDGDTLDVLLQVA